MAHFRFINVTKILQEIIETTAKNGVAPVETSDLKLI